MMIALVACPGLAISGVSPADEGPIVTVTHDGFDNEGLLINAQRSMKRSYGLDVSISELEIIALNEFGDWLTVLAHN